MNDTIYLLSYTLMSLVYFVLWKMKAQMPYDTHVKVEYISQRATFLHTHMNLKCILYFNTKASVSLATHTLKLQYL